MSYPDSSNLPSFIFSTPSPLVASWLIYSQRLQYNHYDPERKLYLFYDPDSLALTLIHDYNQVDPTVSLRRFHRTYKNVFAEKLREDGRTKAARKAVRRG